MVNYFTNFEWPDESILRVLLSVSVFQCWSWPGIAALSRPAEFWQRMTQNRLTSLPEGGVEREWEEKGIGDGVETQVVDTGGKNMKRWAETFWKSEQESCVFCVYTGPTSNIYSLLSSDLCVTPLSTTLSISAERGTDRFTDDYQMTCLWQLL